MEVAGQASRASQYDLLASYTRGNDGRNSRIAVVVTRHGGTHRSPSSQRGELQWQWRRQNTHAAYLGSKLLADASVKTNALSNNGATHPTPLIRSRRSSLVVSPNGHCQHCSPCGHGRLSGCYCSSPTLGIRGERAQDRHSVQSLACNGTHSRHATGFGNASDISMMMMKGDARASLRCQAEPTEGISVESIGDMLADVEAGAATDVDDFPRARLAVFVSGGGSNMRAIHKACTEGRVYGEIVLVVSDKPGCGGWQFAVEQGIDVVAYPAPKKPPPPQQQAGGTQAAAAAAVTPLTEAQLIQALRSHAVDYVLLAGYLKLLPPSLVGAFPRSILNIHPALLPAFGGKGYFGSRVHEAVIRSGARVSGPTVHFVDERYDHGPIIAQRVVPVLPSDTPHDLQLRVLEQEHDVYVHVVAALCEGRVMWREDGVPLIRAAWGGSELE